MTVAETAIAEEFRAHVTRCVRASDTREAKVLALAAWCAENIENGNPSTMGTVQVLRERLGHCGARARMFVELLAAAGIEARVFGIYTPGLRHTVTHARLDGRDRFVDPQYGCVCRIDGELLSFEDMCMAPATAAANLEFPATPGRATGRDDDARRIAAAQRLYSSAQLAKTRSFGFLHDERRIDFPFTCALDGVGGGVGCEGPADRIGFIEAGKSFGVAPPNFFGATDKVPRHLWEFTAAEVGARYEIRYRLKGFRGALTIEAQSDSVVWFGPTQIDVTAADERPRDLVLSFEARDATPKIAVGTDFAGWGNAAIITAILVRRIDGG